MATVNPTWTICSLPNATEYGDGKGPAIIAPWVLMSVKWNNVDGGDTCTEAPLGWMVDKSVQISGTTVTSLAIQGSNDNVEYYVLNDPQGNALSGISAEKIEQVLENTWYVKPVVTT